MRAIGPIATLLPLLGALACADVPKLAAEGSGDLSHPLAQRLSPDALLLQQCGDGKPLPAGVELRRRPYLTSVTAHAAQVRFTAREAGDLTVEVTHPDGSLVQRAPALRVAGVPPGPGGAWLREARLAALEPDTTYCYAIAGATGRAGFRTAPTATTSRAVRFVVWGDSGTGTSYQRAVADRILSVPFDFALHAGDVAYEDGTRSELEAYFFGMYPALTRSFPVFPVIGNHDRATEDGAPLREAFGRPTDAALPADSFYYSFDWGPVHFVALDTNRVDPAQAEWLDGDLQRNALPWVIAYGHSPPYSSGEHGSDAAFRRLFVPILEKHRVPLVFSGHEHDYERTRPIHGITYVVTGGGGRGTRSVLRSDFTAYSEDVLHFVYVELEGKTLLLHAIDGVGREFDAAKLELQ